jgi:N-acetylglucosaminyldiphosphoundecaprenol N-acetyl-beta-D-mannosaminyltransferase
MTASPHEIEPEKVPLAGFPIARLDRTGFLEFCRDLLRVERAFWIVTVNLEMFSRCRLDAAYRDLLLSADVLIADGMPLVWGSKMKRRVPRLPERLAGADLTADLLQLAPAEKIAVIGGKNPRKGLANVGLENAERAYVFEERVEATPEQADRFARELNERGIEIVFLGLGVPKQDRLAALLRERLKKGIVIGVGGTFDLLAGELKRAPAFVRKAGFEWLFRLLQEPRRLAHRYLVLYWVGGFALAGDIVRSWFKPGTSCPPTPHRPTPTSEPEEADG